MNPETRFSGSALSTWHLVFVSVFTSSLVPRWGTLQFTSSLVLDGVTPCWPCPKGFMKTLNKVYWYTICKVRWGNPEAAWSDGTHLHYSSKHGAEDSSVCPITDCPLVRNTARFNWSQPYICQQAHSVSSGSSGVVAECCAQQLQKCSQSFAQVKEGYVCFCPSIGRCASQFHNIKNCQNWVLDLGKAGHLNHWDFRFCASWMVAFCAYFHTVKVKTDMLPVK